MIKSPEIYKDDKQRPIPLFLLSCEIFPFSVYQVCVWGEPLSGGRNTCLKISGGRLYRPIQIFRVPFPSGTSEASVDPDPRLSAKD